MKQVTVSGITWKVISQNERCCVHGGRFFSASRCNNKTAWRLAEDDGDITASADGVKELGFCPVRLETKQLSGQVLSIVEQKQVLPVRELKS